MDFLKESVGEYAAAGWLNLGHQPMYCTWIGWSLTLVDASAKAKSVLIIEDDPAWRKVLRKYLNQTGVPTIEVQEDGDAAWAALSSHKKPRYDIILLDWNVPRVNGLSLLNRIRKSDTYCDTPVLIISGYLQDDDFRLFEEFPLTEGLAKPVSVSALGKSIDLLMRESAWFRKEREEIIKIFQRIDSGAAQSLFQLRQLVATSPKPNALVISAAKLLIFSERYLAAEELLSFFLDDTPDSLTGLNQLAKVYLHTRRYKEAASILSRAQKMSPKNLERLCILGDAKLHTLQIDEAQRTFERALQVDRQNLQARVGRDFAGIVEPKLARLADDAIPRAYSSLLNSKGIVAARAGMFDDAIDQYRSAMVYTIDPLTKGRVAFNVGLAYMRWAKAEDALAWFQRSINYSRGQFLKAGKKMAELNERLQELGGKIDADDISLVGVNLLEGTLTRSDGISGSELTKSSVDQDIEEFERIEIPDSLDINDLLNDSTKKAG